ncbi:MAG TPA: DUF4386 domain-containing protein [Candidatus Angelobacter sp.]|nr:DUF4386 domain-containing protein [Candidatus Angelobacter sp.]
MMERIAEASPRFKARMAGVLSLLSLLAAVFGEFIVRRFEIAGDLAAVSGNIVVTLLLYGIFKPVNRGLSLLAASFNLVGLTCGALRWIPRGVDIPVVFDGFYCLLTGYLIIRSTFLPRILGALVAFAGLGWLTYLSPPLANHLFPYNLALGILGQESVMLWLLVMGTSLHSVRLSETDDPLFTIFRRAHAERLTHRFETAWD